jgi:hypothetical protein
MLFAESGDDLQKFLHGFVTMASIFNMSISIEKTQAIVIAKEPIKYKLAVNNRIIQSNIS